jgi:hypothetical protein
MKSKKAFLNTVTFIVGLAIVGLVTAAVIATFRGSVSSKAPITATSNPTTTAEEPTTQIPNPYPIPAYSLTPDIGATQTIVQYAIQYSTEHPVTFPTVYVTPVPPGTAEGVFTIASGNKLGLDTQNGWHGFVDGNKVDIYSGALSDDADQGAIFLFVEIPRSGIGELIQTPTKHGAVHVVSEQDNRLTLVSTDGTTYYFDLPARRFVDSLTEVVPSATPPVTETPLPPLPTIDFSILTSAPTYNPYPVPTGQSTAAP